MVQNSCQPLKVGSWNPYQFTTGFSTIHFRWLGNLGISEASTYVVFGSTLPKILWWILKMLKNLFQGDMFRVLLVSM